MKASKVLLLIFLSVLSLSVVTASDTAFVKKGICGGINKMISAENLESSPHAILIESPNNYTIYKNTMPLNFTVTYLHEDGIIVWQYLTSLSYSIDGKLPVTIMNKTGQSIFTSYPPVQWSTVLNVSELSNGQHKIEVTATFVGCINYDFILSYTFSSAPVYFTIAQQSEPQQSEPFPTTWIVAAIAVIAIGVIAAILVYFRKIKKTTGKAE